MKVTVPVTLVLTAEELLRVLRHAGYIVPDDTHVKVSLLGTDNYFRSVNLMDKKIININWDISVEVGGPNKCKKDSES